MKRWIAGQVRNDKSGGGIGMKRLRLPFRTRATGTRPPIIAAALLALIVTFCLAAPLLFSGTAGHMDFNATNLSPSLAHPLGTDSLGRDLLKMIAYGGRSSLFIGITATVLSTTIAVLYGALSGLASNIVDNLLMRGTELLLSIPSILYVAALQAIIGKPSALSLALVIGVSSWMAIAKIVRSEVRQLRQKEYVESAQLMGAKLPYILRTHLFANFLPTILFMVVSNISQAIAAEAALSFLGIGLSPSIISWGTLMALAETALLSGSWWVVVFPGTVLTITLMCSTDLGEALRRRNARRVAAGARW